MKKAILIISAIAIICGIIGFTTNVNASTFFRMMFLVFADIAVILFLGRFVFFTEKGKALRQRIAVRPRMRS